MRILGRQVNRLPSNPQNPASIFCSFSLMKTSSIVIALLAFITLHVQAQIAGDSFATSYQTNGVSSISGSQPVVAKLAAPIVRPDATARRVVASNSVVSLVPAKMATNNQSEQRIQPVVGGAKWSAGLARTAFAANLAAPYPISITTPDLRQLRCRPSFLAYHDTVSGKYVLLGKIQPRIGSVVGRSQVLFEDAFTGINAAVRYTCKGRSLEQDIILRQRPPNPKDLGLNPLTTELQTWTEWFDSPPLARQTRKLADGETDEAVDFGAMKLVAGYAYTDTNQLQGVAVGKHWVRSDNRDFLVESVSYAKLTKFLEKLPTTASVLPKRLAFGSEIELVRDTPAARTVKPSDSAEHMQLALASPTMDGVVLDFVIVASVPLPAGAVSWWPAGGNAQDALPAGNNGVWTGTSNYGAGEMGQGFTFDGNSKVGVSNAPSLNPTNSLTVEAWINEAVNPNARRDLISKDGAISDRQYFLTISGTNDTFRAYVSTTNGLFYIDGQTAVDSATWYHVAMTYNAATSNLLLYVNGELDASGTVTGGPLITTTQPVRIGGGAPSGSPYYFNGTIDEPTIYDRTLGATEIQAIYEAGGAGKNNPDCVTPPTGILGWWPGDENVYDYAGTNNGTANNNTGFAPAMASHGFIFDGESNVEVPDAPGLNPTNGVTVEAWINEAVNPYDHRDLVSKDGEWWDRQYFLTISGDYGAFRAHVSTADGLFYIDGQTVVDSATWYHVAMTYDAATSNLLLYVNGQLDASGTVTGGPLITTTQPVRIGGGAPEETIPYYFNGTIDEPAIYNRALGAEEIGALYAAGCAGKCKTDLDYDGLGDWWEWKYFGSYTNTGTNLDYAGNTLLYDYANGLNPTNYYDGVLPILTIVSGDNQNGTTNTFLPLALTVRVTNTNGVPLINAPLNFTVSVGEALIAISTNGVTTNSIAVRTGTNGQAAICALMPPSWQSLNQITAAAWSGTNEVQVTFTATALQGIKLWLRADAGVTNSAGAVSAWADQSGNANTATQVTSGNRPAYVTNALNGLPVIRFDGMNSYFGITNFLAGTTEAEVLAVLKTATNPPPSPRFLWWLGTISWVAYPTTSGEIVEGFGTLTPYNIGVPAQALTRYHLYEVSGSSGNWRAWINGVLQAQSPGNTYGVNPNGTYYLGRNPEGGYMFAGDVAEVLIFNRTLAADERVAVNGYLNGKYGLVSAVPPTPTNLLAKAVSTNQISLTWSQALTNGGATRVSIERSLTSNGVFTAVAQVSLATSYVDTNLMAGTNYYYRLRAANLTQWSGYSTLASATTLTNGASVPFEDLLLWLKADAGLTQIGTNTAVNVWADQSGRDNHATQPTAANQPAWIAGALNGLPAIRFDGVNSYLGTTNFLKGTTGAEVLAVLKVAANPPPSPRFLWWWGTISWVAYTTTSGEIVEGFGTLTPYNIGAPAQSLTQYHLYDVTGSSGNWGAWINGMLLQQAATNIYGINAHGTYYLGRNPEGGYMFAGDVAEILVFKRPLTAGERGGVANYLFAKYSLAQFATNALSPGTPTNMVATGVSPSQINLRWSRTSTNELLFEVERKSGTNGVYQKIGSTATSTTNFSDMNVSPTDQCFYRVMAKNLFGQSGYSTEIAPPFASLTLLSTNDYIVAGTTNGLLAQASDVYGTINQMKIVSGYTNLVIGTGTTMSYTNLWVATSPATYSMAAVATDTLGNSRYSASLNITIYRDSNGDGIADALQVLQGNDPLNPWVQPSGDTNATPPNINLLVPANATLLP